MKEGMDIIVVCDGCKIPEIDYRLNTREHACDATYPWTSIAIGKGCLYVWDEKRLEIWG